MDQLQVTNTNIKKKKKNYFVPYNKYIILHSDSHCERINEIFSISKDLLLKKSKLDDGCETRSTENIEYEISKLI